jgi:Short C-terminal domain
MAELIVYLILWGSAVFVAWRLGQKKNREWAWIWGFMLGWLGVIILLFFKKREDTSLNTDKMEQLSKLADLRGRNAITEEEFIAEKARILA